HVSLPSFMRVERGVDPALGSVTETGVWWHTGHFDVFPRPHVLGIRQLEFSLLSWEGVTYLDGRLNSSWRIPKTWGRGKTSKCPVCRHTPVSRTNPSAGSKPGSTRMRLRKLSITSLG